MAILRRTGRFWSVFDGDRKVYENSDYVKAVGVFDYLSFWRTETAQKHRAEVPFKANETVPKEDT